MLQQRRTRQSDWARRTRLNSLFTRRFDWGASLPRVRSAIGSPFVRPDSRRFMFALARWQQRNGLPVTGILTPGVLRRLLAFAPPAGAGIWPQQPPPDAWPQATASEPPAPPADAMADAPDAAGADDTGGVPDDGAMPLPGDEGEPAGAEGNEFAPAVGFRSRRAYAY
jgi:hypothetical protein